MSSEPISGLPSGTTADANLLPQSTGVAGETQKITEAQLASYTIAKLGPSTVDTGSPNAAGMNLIGTQLSLTSATAAFPGAVNATTQTFGGDKTFTGDITANNLSGTNHGDFTTSAIDTVNPNPTGMFLIVGSSSTPANLQLSAATATFGGALTAGAQTIGGDKTFAGNISASNLLGTNTGNVTLNPVGVSSNANGAQLIGQVLELEPASASFPGVVTTASQTFAGAKTFSTAPILSSLATAGIIHNDSSGNLTSSLIIDADVASAANIAPTKLGPFPGGSLVLTTNSVSKKIQESPVTATALESINQTVNQILMGNGASGITSYSSLTFNPSVPFEVIVDGGDAAYSLVYGVFSRSDEAGSWFANSGVGDINIRNNNSPFGINIGIIGGAAELVVKDDLIIFNLPSFTTAGVVHNDNSGNLTSSLIVSSDVDPTFVSGVNHGDFTTSAVDSLSPNPTGMQLIDGTPSTPANLQLQGATAAYPGVVTAVAQTFGGPKTFADGIIPPSGTTTQKNAVPSPSQFQLYGDITLGKLCVFIGAAWQTITSI